MTRSRRTAYKDISLAQLRSFGEVFRTCSYKAAADALGLTPPTVWEQLRGLEDYYGVPLFVRRGRQLEPTEAARQLCELISPLLSGLDSTQEVLRQRRGEWPECLRVVSGLRMLMEEIAAGLKAFSEQCPGIRLYLFHPGEEDLDGYVESGAADVGINIEPGPGSDSPAPGVVHEPAYQMDYLLVAPPDHPLADRKRLRLPDLVRYPLILGRPEDYARRRLEEVLYQHGLLDQLQIAVETSSATVSFAAVRAGIAPAISVGNRDGFLCQGLAVRSLKRWLGRGRFVFVWKRGAYRPPALELLAECIQKNL